MSATNLFTSKSIEEGNVPKLGKITINTFEDDAEVLDLDKIVPIGDALSDEFSKQASLYAYVAMIAAQAEALYTVSDQQLDRAKASADKRIRHEARAVDEKVTETVVAYRVLLDEEVVNAQEENAGYKYQYLLMKAIIKAMEQRAQMLISLGAHLRAEADQTGMLIADTKAHLDNIRQSK